MRRRDKEITDRRVIDEILGEASVCRIAMCDGDAPYLVPMNFGYDGGSIYLHSAPAGRKIDILSRNSRVCFEVDTGHELVRAASPCGWGMKYRSVIGTGTARVLAERPEKHEALAIIMRKYGAEGDFEFEASRVDAVTVIRIDIDQVCGKQATR